MKIILSAGYYVQLDNLNCGHLLAMVILGTPSLKKILAFAFHYLDGHLLDAVTGIIWTKHKFYLKFTSNWKWSLFRSLFFTRVEFQSSNEVFCLLFFSRIFFLNFGSKDLRSSIWPSEWDYNGLIISHLIFETWK